MAKVFRPVASDESYERAMDELAREIALLIYGRPIDEQEAHDFLSAVAKGLEEGEHGQ